MNNSKKILTIIIIIIIIISWPIYNKYINLVFGALSFVIYRLLYIGCNSKLFIILFIEQLYCLITYAVQDIVSKRWNYYGHF
jgi:hypothetical protein